MGEREDLSVAVVLKNLKALATRLYEDEDFRKKIAKELTDEGYKGCDDKDADQVIRVLARAVTSPLIKFVDIQINNNEQLNKLLASPSGRSKPIEHLLSVTSWPTLKSPLDLANKEVVGIKQGAPHWFLKNLIERQFQIKWATKNGEPDEFNFYKFCDLERLKPVKSKNKHKEMTDGKTAHLKYKPRNAHVKTQLYRHCSVNTKNDCSKEQLCPPVYMRTKEKGWIKCNPVKKKFIRVTSQNIKFSEHFSWIKEPIRNFISETAVEIGDSVLENVLKKHTLYWAVVQDTDFQSGNLLKIKDIGETQVYVGKANNGVEGRWLKDNNSHCRMMKKCLDNVQIMATYQPKQLKDIQLVDARLLLAKLRSEKCALFVMKTYCEDDKNDLEAHEKKHIDGLKIKSKNKKFNIVPAKICRDWKPKYMAYGMNGRN